jgi:hypothetical protein
MIMEKQELLGSFCFFLLLENIRMRFYVMLCLYMLLIYCWGDLWNFREKPSVIGWRTCILFKKMGRHSHLYYCPLDKCMKINWNWKEKVKPKKKINHVRMWERVKKLTRNLINKDVLKIMKYKNTNTRNIMIKVIGVKICILIHK